MASKDCNNCKYEMNDDTLEPCVSCIADVCENGNDEEIVNKYWEPQE